MLFRFEWPVWACKLDDRDDPAGQKRPRFDGSDESNSLSGSSFGKGKTSEGLVNGRETGGLDGSNAMWLPTYVAFAT